VLVWVGSRECEAVAVPVTVGGAVLVDVAVGGDVIVPVAL
jgi:hypothetical protein